MNDYQPRPGTVAYRVLGFLEAEEPREFTVAEIFESLQPRRRRCRWAK